MDKKELLRIVDICMVSHNDTIATNRLGEIKAQHNIPITKIRFVDLKDYGLDVMFVHSGSMMQIVYRMHAERHPNDTTMLPVMLDGQTYGKANASFVKAADAARAYIDEEVVAFILGGGTRIIFAGHAGGGACAVVSAIQTAIRHKEISCNSCVTFGSPPIGDIVFDLVAISCIKEIVNIATPYDKMAYALKHYPPHFLIKGQPDLYNGKLPLRTKLWYAMKRPFADVSLCKYKKYITALA